MRVIVLPQYDTATPHVVVDSVFLQLLPDLGYTVDVVRPSSASRALEEHPRSTGEGRLFTFPYESSSSPAGFMGRRRRRRQCVGEALEKLASNTIDAVIVRNDLVDADAAARFAADRRIPFVFQYTSPDPEFRINGPRNRFELGRVLHVIRGRQDLGTRRRTCRAAAAVLPISARMRRYMVDRGEVEADRAFVLPMGIGSNPAPSAERIDEARRALALPWQHTIAYSGVIHELRQPGFMLDVLERVRRQNIDAGLLVMTRQQDDRRRAFEAEAAARGLPVRVVGPLHHADVSAYVRCADVLLCPVPPRIEFAMMSPTKTLEALGAGVPVVGSVEVDEHRLLLTESGGGVAVPFNADAYADAVGALLRDARRRGTMGATGRRFVRRFRTYPRLARYLDTVLQAVVQQEPLARLPHDPDETAWDEAAD